jgi:hypothetical protein
MIARELPASGERLNPMRSRVTFWLQLASLLVTGWLLWRPAWFGRWPFSPLWTIAQAATLACMACIAGGIITLALFLLLRQDPEYMLQVPLRASAAAIWFAPAIILFAERSPASMLAALVLVINATRVLYEQWRVGMAPAPAELSLGLFGRFYAPVPSFWQLLAPALAGSLLAQIGIAAALLKMRALAGFALAMAAATITVFAQSSRAVEPQRPPNLPRSFLGLLLTLVLAIGLTVGGMFPRFAGRSHGFGDGGTASAPTAGMTGPPGTAMPQMPQGTADSGFFGVILWPEIKPYATLIAPMPQTKGGLGMAAPQRPWSIPFSGEYWMYRWPFAHPPQNSYRQRGSPADLSFSTTDRRPLQMEARHKLEQPVAADCCSSMRVEVRNADRYPGTISIEAYLIDGQAMRFSQVWLGRAVLKSQPAISGDTVQPVPETLEFPFPATSAITQFDELKLVFLRDPRRADKSAKVAIERFVLMPR